MKLSVVIPAYNEEESLPETINSIYLELHNEKIDHEILVINDNSQDKTIDVLNSLITSINTLRYITNIGSSGFGYAVRKGLENFSGDCVAVMMADLSDSPQDLTRFYRTMVEGNYDCVFGSRFIKGGKTYDYPKFKKIVNRVANRIISWYNRKYGKSNLKIREMGSRYLFILLYCLVEKFFSRGDFKKKW